MIFTLHEIKIHIKLFQNKIKSHKIFFDLLFGQNMHLSTLFWTKYISSDSLGSWVQKSMMSLNSVKWCKHMSLLSINNLQNWYKYIHSNYIYVKPVYQKAFFYAFISQKKIIFLDHQIHELSTLTNNIKLWLCLWQIVFA